MTDDEYAAFREYVDAEREDVKARYGGFNCAACVYWFVDDWRTEKAVALADERNSPPHGQCRRRAPGALPELGFMAIGGLIGAVAWATEEAANIEHGALTDYAFEKTEFEIDFWPFTEATAWCGEGRPGRKAMSAEMIARLEALHAKACPADPLSKDEEEENKAAEDASG